ncbi:MAG TPA: HIT domain-containing protein [Candidatus Babeliales bacterium]|nr:HIT domain-containing protein [Candidatus Babeliales bacterium]
MKKMYAPWRTPYTKREAKKKGDGCVFCTTFNSSTDKDNFVLFRGKHCFVILNLYPYNAGHVLVLPNKHVDDLNDLNAEERTEMMELTNKASQILKNKVKAKGINIGLNLGEVAGGGIPDHIHMHVLPRWPHDTNFMPLIADTKLISIDLNDVYDLLKDEFQ